jgi:hypothetical protein
MFDYCYIIVYIFISLYITLCLHSLLFVLSYYTTPYGRCPTLVSKNVPKTRKQHSNTNNKYLYMFIASQTYIYILVIRLSDIRILPYVMK